mgnify:CR=1 FL=1|jgi:hypothetical protein
MVDEWSHCPENLNWLNTTAALENPEMLLGKKCCIRILDYQLSWYERRYADDTYPCQEALKEIDAYITFVRTMANPGTGVITRFTA